MNTSRPHLSRAAFLSRTLGWLLLLATGSALAAVGAGTMTVLTRSAGGQQAQRGASAFSPSASQDGRYVAFESDAVDYAPCRVVSRNVFVKDLLTGQVELVSQSTGGVPANGESSSPSISADGRYVAFRSSATNLIDGKVNQTGEVYVRDRLSGVTERVSRPADGSEAPIGHGGRALELSRDGRYVLYDTWNPGVFAGAPQVGLLLVLHDRLLGQSERVSVRPDGSPVTGISIVGADMTPDASHIVFTTHVRGRMELEGDIWLRDRAQGVTRQMNVNTLGQIQWGYWRDSSISDDGREALVYRLGFLYGPSGLELRNAETRATETWAELEDVYSGSLSPDGRSIVYYDLGGLLRFDRATRTSQPIVAASAPASELPVDPAGEPGAAGLWFSGSDDVVFATYDNHLVPGDENGKPDVYLVRRFPPSVARVSVKADGTEAGAPAESREPSQSPDGRYVVFTSDARDLAPGNSRGAKHVYLLDRSTGVFEQIDVSTAGESANVSSPYYDAEPQVSADGRYVLFSSPATNLVSGEAAGIQGPFIRDRLQGTTIRFSPVGPGSYADGPFTLSANGRWISYVAGGSAYVFDRRTGQSELVNVGANGRMLTGRVAEQAMSADGRYVYGVSYVAGNPANYVWMRDRQLRRTQRIFSSRYLRSQLSTSADGRFVTYWVLGTGRPGSNRYDRMLLYDRVTRRQEVVSVPPPGFSLSYSLKAALSPEGRYVVFQCQARAPDGSLGSTIFLRDRVLARTELVTRRPDGGRASPHYGFAVPAVSANGRHVVFESRAKDLIADEDVGGVHIYSLDRP